MGLAFESHDLALPLGVAAGVAAILWSALVFALALSTRARKPEPQPAGLEMGGREPPAVVDLMCHGWRLGREAVAATLVDLAARKVVAFEPAGPDHYRVLVSGPEPPGLVPYETQVLAHVRGLAHNGVVPCEALTTGPEDASKRWFRRFERAVVRDARDRGVSRSRWSRPAEVLVGAAAVIPAVAASGAITVLSPQKGNDSSPVGAFIGLSFIVWFALMACFAGLHAERDTKEGRQAAGRWLGLAENLRADGTFPELPPTAVAIWDRYLAYAVAFGLAATTARTVALGSESERQAWSAVGGRWRVVRVRYPSRVPPGWGRPPWRVLAAGVIQSAVLAGLLVVGAPALIRAGRSLLDKHGGDQQALTLALKAAFFVFIVVLVVWLVRAVAMLLIGLLDVARARTVEGQVLRLRRRNEKDRGVVTHVAVDDGTDDQVLAWIPSAPPAGMSQGCWVRAVVSPRLCFVRSLEIVAAPGDSAPAGRPSSASGVHDRAPAALASSAANAALADPVRPTADPGSVAASSGASPLRSLDSSWVSQLVGTPVEVTDAGVATGFVAQFKGEDAHVMVSVAPAGMGWEMYQQAARVPRLARSAVAGCGDEALWIMRSSLVTRRGDITLTVGVRVKSLDNEQRQHVAVEIAKRVLGSG